MDFTLQTRLYNPVFISSRRKPPLASLGLELSSSSEKLFFNRSFSLSQMTLLSIRITQKKIWQCFLTLSAQTRKFYKFSNGVHVC